MTVTRRMKPIIAANLQITVRTEMKRLDELHNSGTKSPWLCLKPSSPNMEITAVTHALAHLYEAFFFFRGNLLNLCGMLIGAKVLR